MPRPRTAIAAAVAAGVAAILGAPPGAWAHQSSPQVRTELQRIAPSAPEGVDIEVIESISTTLSVVNRTNEPVEVLDTEGEPFLRIGPEGVEADVNSVAWYRSNDPFGTGGLPERLADDPPPRFRQVTDEPTWAWFDHRLHPEPRSTVPREALQGGRAAVLADWRIPMRYGGRPLAAVGQVRFRPIRGSVGQQLTSPPFLGDATSVQLLPGKIPGLFVDHQGEEPLVVRGRAGELFARFTPEGVEVNLRSPTHVDDQRLRGESPTVAADPDAPPRWEQVAEVPRYDWLESRAGYGREAPPAEIVERGESTVLERWAVPVTLGGAPERITGTTTWTPLARVAAGGPQATSGGGPGAALWIVLAAVLAAGLGGAVTLRRRVARRA